MSSYDEIESIVDEINALRNDLIERGGIVDELKKIRELLESINWMLKEKLFSPAAGFESNQNPNKITEGNHENK